MITVAEKGKKLLIEYEFTRACEKNTIIKKEIFKTHSWTFIHSTDLNFLAQLFKYLRMQI